MGGQRVGPAARDDRVAERRLGVPVGARAGRDRRAAGRGRAPGRARRRAPAPAAGRAGLAAHLADCQRGRQPGRRVPRRGEARQRARGGPGGRARARGRRARRARRGRLAAGAPARPARQAAAIIQQLAYRGERAQADAPVRHHREQVQRQQQTWRRAQRRGRGRVEARAAEVGGTGRLANHAAICAARPSGPHDQGSCLLREPVHDVRGLDGVGLRAVRPPRLRRPARALGLEPTHATRDTRDTRHSRHATLATHATRARAPRGTPSTAALPHRETIRLNLTFRYHVFLLVLSFLFVFVCSAARL